jgi:serine/threonine protein kinase
MEHLEPGTPFGPYVVEGFIAAGGMGHVYAARHAVYGSPVALKVLLPTLDVDGEWRARFTTEGAVGQQLKHPHVCSARELVEQAGQLGLVLDLVSGGKTLARGMADRREGLPLATAMRLFLGVLQGVAHAHARGVVHGDIKPENVLIDGDIRDPSSWTLLVTDFGTVGMVAHPVLVDGRSAVVVSPRYASPEHVRGVSALVPQSDVYALGLLMHFVVSGEHASGASTVAEAAEHVASPQPILHLVDQPTAVLEIFQRCTAVDPDDRYETVEQLALDVRRALDALGEGVDPDLAADLATELVEERAGEELTLDSTAASSEHGAPPLLRMDASPGLTKTLIPSGPVDEVDYDEPVTEEIIITDTPAPLRVSTPPPPRDTSRALLGVVLLGLVLVVVLGAVLVALL